MEKINNYCIKIDETDKREEESWKQYNDRIKETFEKKLEVEHYYKSIKIKFNKKKDKEKRYNCYGHITTASIYGSWQRRPDRQRLETCLYAIKVIDCVSYIKCLGFYEKQITESRISLYCAKFKYVVILEKRPIDYYFITSFPVANRNERKFI